MARRSRSTSRSGARRPENTSPPTLPVGDVVTTTGTVRLERDPDLPTGVTVLVNGVPSSYVDLADPGLLTFEYMQQMAALVDGLAPSGSPLRVVHLGAAGCTLARWIDHERPGSRQIGVDVDTTLLELVRGWFDLPRSPRLRLRAGDARAVLTSLPSDQSDVVVRDVFAGDSTPAHVTTAEFVADVRRVLRPGGVYLANCADKPPLARLRAEVATFREAFGDDRVAVVAEPALLRSRRYGNFVVVGVEPSDGEATRGTDEPTGPDLDSPSLERALRSLSVPARIVHGPEVVALAGTARPLRDPS